MGVSFVPEPFSVGTDDLIRLSPEVSGLGNGRNRTSSACACSLGTNKIPQVVLQRADVGRLALLCNFGQQGQERLNEELR